MTTKTVRAGTDAWVNLDKPDKNHGDSDVLRVDSGHKRALVYLASPAPRGTVVSSGRLHLHADGASTGTRTVTAELLAGKWDQGKVTWKNQPDVTGTPATVTIGNLADGDEVVIDVTAHLADVAFGAKFYGWRISTSDTAGHQFTAFGSKGSPKLLVSYDHSEPVPIDLSPAGAIDVAKPRLKFNVGTKAATGGLHNMRVQIDPAANWTTPAWDSGPIRTTVPELDLATTTYPGLADGDTTKWRVGSKAADGTWQWSLAATMTRVDFASITFLSPAATPDDYVSEHTPPIIWAAYAGQDAFRLQITPAGDHTKVLADSDKTKGADNSWTVPKKVLTKDGKRYTAILTIWDDRTDRAPGYRSIQASQDFTLTLDPTVDPVTNLTASQPDGSPLVRLTFLYPGDAPDSFTFEVDGEAADSDLDPDDLIVAPGQYVYDYWGATAYTPHTFRILPVVNGHAAADGPAATITPRIVGAWLCDPGTGARFNLLSEQLNLSYGEDAEVKPKAGQDFTRKITSMRGLEGDVSGVLAECTEYDPRTLVDQVADVYTIKGRQPSRIFRFAAGDLNIPVVVGNVSLAPGPEYVEHIKQWAVSYWVGQRGELPYTVEL